MVLNLEDAVESTLEVLEYELERPPSSGGSSVSSLCDDELRRLHAEREAKIAALDAKLDKVGDAKTNAQRVKQLADKQRQ